MTHLEYNARASERELRRKAINYAADKATEANDNQAENLTLVAFALFCAFVVAGTAILMWAAP